MTAKKDAFVKAPMWWVAEAAKATGTPATLVCFCLLYSSWKARSMSFTLPNGWLQQRGVSRKIKRRVLRDLEAAGLITVEQPSGKSPIITLTVV